jgi:D-amino-acid dehydrogenase
VSRVVIVGAGVVGLAAAHSLRRRGHEVTLVDRGSPGRGCSWSNAGWICPSLSAPLASSDLGPGSLPGMLHRDSPLHIGWRSLPRLAPWLWQFWRRCNARDYARGVAAIASLNMRTMQAFDAWVADGVDFEMHRAGILWAFLDARRAEGALRALAPLEALGGRIPQPMDGPALRAIEPGLAPAVRAGFVVDGERHVRPESLMEGLVRRLTTLGVELRPGLQVTGGRARGGSLECLHTTNGDVQADRFVIAAGAWSGPLTAALGAPLPVQAGKGYSVTLASPSAAFHRAVYLPEVKVAVSPFDGQLRVAGTMELSGINTRLDARRVRALERSASRFLREVPAWSRGEAWVGARPITPDGLPFIGLLPGYRNVFVAAGHGMLGVTLAPATADLLADLMQEREGSGAANPFDPAR